MARWLMSCIGAVICGAWLCACGPALRRSGHSPAAADAAQALLALDAGRDKPATGYLPPGAGGAGQDELAFDAAAGATLVPDAPLDGGAGLPDSAIAHVPAGDAGPAPAASPAVADVVITELMIDPVTHTDSSAEWLELYNVTANQLSLRGCELSDASSKPHALAGGLLIGARSYATIARSAQAGFIPSSTATFSLTNGAGHIALSCHGLEIDRVAYDKAQGYPVGSGASMQLDPSHLDAASNDRPSAWCLARRSYGPELGTPGTRNASCSDEDAGSLAP